MDKVYKEAEKLEGFEAWRRYGESNFRWVFNKLELAVRQNLDAGPSGTTPEKAGTYIIRPIYNIYGSGLGAKKFEYDPYQHKEAMLNGDIVPPGYFWCQWLSGSQYSIDYRRLVTSGDAWGASSVLEGFHKSEDNLTKFAFWNKIDISLAPAVKDLPLKFDFEHTPAFTSFNVKLRGGIVTGVHLSLRNNNFDDVAVGGRIIPVWEGDAEVEGEWRDNPESVIDLSTTDKLSAKRLGFRIQQPSS